MKKKIIIGIISILFLVISIIAAVTLYNNSKYTTLVQLSPQGIRQMMSYLIKTNTGKIILIDSGTKEDADNLLKYIKENGNKVDYWFLTHAHDDHVGAFTKIVNETDIKIDNIYVSVNEIEWYEKNEELRVEFTKEFINTLKSEKIKNIVKEPYVGQIINIDNLEIEILGIRNTEIIENAGNEQSMVFTINTGKTKLLILGDTGEKSGEKLLNTKKEKLKSDIVQMAHHGQQGVTEEFYKVVNPKICLWPTPEWLWNNDIGDGINTGPWKTLDTREWIEKLNITKNYIAKDGDITVKIK